MIETPIIAEERLEEAFNLAPPIDVQEPNGTKQLTLKYEFGSLEDLNKFLAAKAKESSYPYPLIFLQTGIEVTGGSQNGIAPLRFIIATRGKRTPTPRQRLNTTVRYRLKPAFDAVIKTLKRSGIGHIVDDYDRKTEVHYNYGPDGELETKEIWDVLTVELEYSFTNNPAKQFNY